MALTVRVTVTIGPVVVVTPMVIALVRAAKIPCFGVLFFLS